MSIQLQLGGLSFYCSINGKYSFRQIREENEISDEIIRELGSDKYDVAYLYHNSTDYIVIPLDLFDENMCEAYLQTKGITADDKHVIVSTIMNSYVYVSVFNKNAYQCLKNNFSNVNILPIIVKVINYGASYDFDMMPLIVQDELLHVAYYENKILKFCESLPINSDFDIDFFIDNILTKYKPNKNLKVISLYETGKYALSRALVSKYKVMKITKDNYYTI